MRNPRFTIVTLLVLLALSNAYWGYSAVDSGVTLAHQDQSLDDHREALAQALAILAVVSSGRSYRPDVVDAARREARDDQSFEKDGFLWIGRIGLRFGPDGRLQEAVPAWDEM